jgi:hypothetical protein
MVTIRTIGIVLVHPDDAFLISGNNGQFAVVSEEKVSARDAVVLDIFGQKH